MKILQVHNYYQQAGGEDAVVEAERALLEAKGNDVIPFYKSNDTIPGCGTLDAEGGMSCLKSKVDGLRSLSFTALKTIWNHQTYREFRKLLQKEKPDVVHCHNTFPLISPSIYWACAKENVPVVQTLHNYRLLCLNAFLFRTTKKKHGAWSAERGEPSSNNCQLITNNSICELCIHKSFKWPGIKYGCYRDSKAGSFVVALMLFVHKLIGTWSQKVTAYIALTEFQKQKMIEGGLPEHKIWVKPNFLQRSEGGDQRSETSLTTINGQLTTEIKRPYALFVGRLSPEKGCDVLLKAWGLFEQQSAVSSQQSDEEGALSSDLCSPTSANEKRPGLLIVGDGPERESLEQLTSDLGSLTSVHFLGKQPKEEVVRLMAGARFLALPSLWYEGFPMTIVEALSQGCPVVASNIGSMTSVIEHHHNGLLFEAGDSADLFEKIEWAFGHSDEIRKMGTAAREDFEEKYSADVNYKKLIAVYEAVGKGQT
jgi:glycosyltransferase involved in cell wall biosynthesis